MTDLYTDYYDSDEPDAADDRPAAFRVDEAADRLACDEGAAMLRDRIAARQWTTAPAVASGEQPLRDPDASFVAEVGDGYRVYLFPADGNGDGPRILRKTLVDGFWRAAENAGD